MELEYASSGNTAALRAWLRQHPERVNLPVGPSKFTLLHTAVQQRQLETVRVLLNEFHADPAVPCGGLGNTAVHDAASSGDTVLLAVLLTHRPPLRGNALMETPTDVARGGCRDMLRNYEYQQQQQIQMQLQMQFQQQQSQLQQQRRDMGMNNGQWGSGVPRRSPPPPPAPNVQLPQVLADTLRETIRDLRVMSDDDNGSSIAQHISSASDSLSTTNTMMMGGDGGNIARMLATPQVQRNTNILSPGIGTNTMHENQMRGNGMVVNPISIPPRNTHKLPSDSILPLDLHVFRRVYGNGFDFAESSCAYQIRGVLPYKFKGRVYYTPVIIIVKKRLNINNNNNNGSRNNNANMLPYRALIDRNNLGELLVSRRATYIDRSSGVIIPNPMDAHYCTLVEFVENAVIANFERIPPLTASTNSRQGIQYDAPLFTLFPNEHELTLRILRDLSFFCDDAFQYNSSTRTITGTLPLFADVRRVGTVASDTKVNPQLSPRLRDGVSFSPNSNNSLSGGGGSGNNNNTILVGELLLKLPISIEFSQQHNFDEPPRVYLTNATTSTPETQENYYFLSSIIINSSTGEVHRSAITSLNKWKEHGSLVNILMELQKTATSLLMKYCKTNTTVPTTSLSLEASPRTKNVNPTASPVVGGSNNSNNNNNNNNITAGGGLTMGRRETSGSIANNECECDGDWLLIPPPSRGSTPHGTTSTRTATETITNLTPLSYTLGSNSNNNNNNNNNGNSTCSTSSKCVICMEADKNFVLLPCRHLVLCRSCSQRYVDRLADGMMCPICRTTVRNVLEVYV